MKLNSQESQNILFSQLVLHYTTLFSYNPTHNLSAVLRLQVSQVILTLCYSQSAKVNICKDFRCNVVNYLRVNNTFSIHLLHEDKQGSPGVVLVKNQLIICVTLTLKSQTVCQLTVKPPVLLKQIMVIQKCYLTVSVPLFIMFLQL